MGNNDRMRFLSWMLILLTGPVFAAQDNDLLGDPEKEAFKPSWNFSLGLSTSGQPSDSGGGAQSTELSFNATYELTESGHFLSLGAMSGRTKVEDGVSTYGTLSIAGGLGLGAFCPSLSLTGQRGEGSLGNLSGGLDLGFQITDELSAGLSGYGGFSSVQVHYLLWDFAVDTRSWGAGASISFMPWDFLVVSLSAQQNMDTTFRVRNLDTSNEFTIEKVVRTPSSALAFDFMPWDDISLNLSIQRGQVFSPAGYVWRPDLGEFVQLPADEISYFWGYTFGASWSFQ